MLLAFLMTPFTLMLLALFAIERHRAVAHR
jgi:hypothetical protein